LEHHYIDKFSVGAGATTWSQGGRADTANTWLEIQKLNLVTNVYEAFQMVLYTTDAVSSRSWLDYALRPGATHYYRLRVRNDATFGTPQVFSVYSNWVTASVAVAGPSGFFMQPQDGVGTAFKVDLIGDTFDTVHQEEASEYHPLGRSDYVFVSDGAKLHTRSFTFEVTDPVNAGRIRDLFETSHGRFMLQGAWPSPFRYLYRVTGQKITEHVANTSPTNLWTFELEAQCKVEY
jgi:hypothetical protein